VLLKRNVLVTLPDHRKAVVLGKKAQFISDTDFRMLEKYREIMRLNQNLLEGTVNIDEDEYKNFMVLAKSNRWTTSSKRQCKAVSSHCAIRAIESALEMWKPITNHAVSSDGIIKSQPQALRYLLEKTWFVYTVISCLKSSLSYEPESESRDLTIEKIYLELYQNEKDHDLMLLKDLNLSRRHLYNFSAFHMTRLVIAHIYWLMNSRPLSFIVALSLFEADSQKKHEVLKTYTKLEEILGVPLLGFKEHFILDLNSGHSELWRKYFSQLTEIETNSLSECLDDLHSTKHIINLWTKEMIVELKAIDRVPYILPVSVFSLLRTNTKVTFYEIDPEEFEK
jgi:hypothetical protein